MKSLRKLLWELRCRLDLRKRTRLGFLNSRSRLARTGAIARYRQSQVLFKVQLGCGGNRLDGWLNTDLSASKGVLYLNAVRPLPFPSNSVDYIFSEHMFEHISYRDGNSLLREASRVLKQGGRIRISTPDLAFLIRLYHESDTDLIKRYIRTAVDSHAIGPRLYERAVVINNFFYSWGHRFIYDLEAISQCLHSAGFVGVTRCQPSESSDPNLQGLESHGRVITEEFNLLESMVVEARKS